MRVTLDFTIVSVQVDGDALNDHELQVIAFRSKS